MVDITEFEASFLTVEQVAAHYKVSAASIWRWKREGDFPAPFNVGRGCTRWRLADIENYDANLETCFVERLDFFGAAA
jgi:prophage regulatory protein